MGAKRNGRYHTVVGQKCGKMKRIIYKNRRKPRFAAVRIHSIGVGIVSAETVTVERAEKNLGGIKDGGKHTVAKIQLSCGASVGGKEPIGCAVQNQRRFPILPLGITEGKLQLDMVVLGADAAEEIPLVFFRKIYGQACGAVEEGGVQLAPVAG